MRASIAGLLGVGGGGRYLLGLSGKLLAKPPRGARPGRSPWPSSPRPTSHWLSDSSRPRAKEHPEWADSISNFRFPDWYRRRLEQEPHEADYCIAASRFTKQVAAGGGNCGRADQTLPLGVDLPEFSPSPLRSDGPFRVLFVGGVGQRKGIKYLLEAYCKMRTAGTELVIVGPLMGSGKACGAISRLLHLPGTAGRQRRDRADAPLPRPGAPLGVRGFGLVVPEAMATGMPAIASTHSIGPEIIRDGRGRFRPGAGRRGGTGRKLDWLAGHRREAGEMGRRAAVQAQVLVLAAACPSTWRS